MRSPYAVDKLFTAATWRRLAGPAERAAEALLRLDERLARTEPALADGVRARAHFVDAQAALGLEGRLVLMEDLVLHDAAMPVRRPTPELGRAAHILATRRRIAAARPDWPFAREGWSALFGAAGRDPDGTEAPLGSPSTETPRRGDATEPQPWARPRFGQDSFDDEDDGATSSGDEDELWTADEASDSAFADIDQLLARSRRTLAEFNDLTTDEGRAVLRVRDPQYGEAERLAAWRRIALKDVQELPTVLAAAVALDAWFALDPSERQPFLGPLLAAALLHQRGTARHHLPALALGLRESRTRWLTVHPAPERLGAILRAVEAAAHAAGRDLDRLSLARELMLRRAQAKRRTSRLPQLVEVFLASPLVTVQSAAQRLGTSAQAIEAMLADLGPACPRELTGRRRYRAWGIV
ncbi:RHE_PE00001 family protein [Methylobacterium nodulans]|uniref:Uncharacterized protein n=1 Tax=Methylobacterium nodulans (strain LMG 21967 / CNCM I-2342 / ORS 2060) TaxID=460265 RepID=B8IVZ4_METNO|nr:RHE_PE00001 family protein [Methylobacterium nodulans]ACL62584.1 protein of unknown function DUF1612 [Methylobacterium nodulans ORS 2060]